MKGSITATAGGTMFAGEGAVAIFRALAIASALDLYAKTGMKANRAYTPKAMIEAATQITGRKFRRRDYAVAAGCLRGWAQTQRANLEDRQ